jgi:adenylate cyclase
MRRHVAEPVGFPGSARLTLGRDNTLQIEDIGSTNGTSIDGERIEPRLPHPLAPGSTLKLGDIELVVRYD